MNTDSVSLVEILAAARRQHASLVVESSGYLLLAISRAMGGLAVDVNPAAVMLRTDGALMLTGPRARVPASQAADKLRLLASRLLDTSIGKGLALRAALVVRDDDKNPLNRLITGVTKALIPINRGAAKRAMARLARETIRAKKRGQLRPEDVQEELTAILTQLHGEEPEPPAPAEEPSAGEADPAQADRADASGTDSERQDLTPSGLSQLDIEVDIQLVTPTASPIEPTLELKTITPVPVAEQATTAAVADAAYAQAPLDHAPLEHAPLDHAPIEAEPSSAGRGPSESMHTPTWVDAILEPPPARVARQTVPGPHHIPRAAAPARTPTPTPAATEEPEVLEEFKIEPQDQPVDADLQGDVTELVEAAAHQLDELHAAPEPELPELSEAPLSAEPADVPQPAQQASAQQPSASVEAMLDGFGGADTSVRDASNSLQEMMDLEPSEHRSDLTSFEVDLEGIEATVTPAPEQERAHEAHEHAAHKQHAEHESYGHVAHEQHAEHEHAEYEHAAHEQHAALAPDAERELQAALELQAVLGRRAEADSAHAQPAEPAFAELSEHAMAAQPQAIPAAASELQQPLASADAADPADAWLADEPDVESGGTTIPPTFIPEAPRRSRSPLVLSVMLLLSGLIAAGALWMRKPELFDRFAAQSAVQEGGSCYAPLLMRDLPQRHEVLLYLGETGAEPLVTQELPTGVRLELVATRAEHQPARVIIGADAEWTAQSTTLQHKLDFKLNKGISSSWPDAPLGSVGGMGTAGQLVIEGATAGAEVWLVLAAGMGDSASITVPCDLPARLLVVDTGATLRQRQLHVQPELLRAAANAGSAELSGKL